MRYIKEFLQDVTVESFVLNSAVCTDGDIRLVGGSVDYEGRVEICINGEYGTVCDDGFDDTDANVICGQLGYGNTGKFTISLLCC